MFCAKCGTELDEGSVFCSKCGNKLVSDNVIEKETAENAGSFLKPVIIIALFCIVGYVVGTSSWKEPEKESQVSYVETETVAEAYENIPTDTYTETYEEVQEDTYTDTYEDDKEHDYDLLSAVYKACVAASYDPEITDAPPCESVVTREYFEDSDWGWQVMDIMGVYSLSEIEKKLKSDESSGTIEIYRDSSGDYNVASGTVVVY